MYLAPGDIETVVPFRPRPTAPDGCDEFADALRARLDDIRTASVEPDFVGSDVATYAKVLLSVLRRAACVVAAALA